MWLKLYSKKYCDFYLTHVIYKVLYKIIKIMQNIISEQNLDSFHLSSELVDFD